MGYNVSSSWRGSSLSEHFCESQPADEGDCHFIPAADTDGLNDLSKQLLIEEGLSRAESFVTLTNVDEENILLSMFAQRHSKAKTVTKINRLAFDEIVESLNIGSVVYPKYITADYILQYVRALQNSVGNRIARLYHIMNNRVEAIEFSISESSPVTDVPLMNLNLKDNQLISFGTKSICASFAMQHP